MPHRSHAFVWALLFATAPVFAGSNFAIVPSREIIVNAPLTPVGSQDTNAGALSKSNGEVATGVIEDTRLKFRHSSDGGATFGPEVAQSGPGQPAVKDAAVALSTDAKIYLAYIVADPGGDTGLRFARSDDMGQSWTTPKVLVTAGNASIGVTKVHVAAGPAGTAAIIYRGSENSDPWVVSTSDSGATFTTPVRIDSAVSVRTFPSEGERVSMDSSGRIYAVYVEDRGSGSTVFYTRSQNGGVSFAPEQPVSLPAHGHSNKPDLQVANDGSVLLTLWDNADVDHVYVLRSVDQGLTVPMVLNRLLANDNNQLEPHLFVDPATSTAFVGWIRSSRELVVDRSTSSGATWGADLVLVASALPGSNATMTRTSAGTFIVSWTDVRSDSYASLLTSVYARSSTDGGATFGTEQRVDGGVAGTHPSVLAGLVPNGSNSVFILYTDGRDENGRSLNLYANRSAASPLSFPADARVDLDDGTVPPEVIPGTAIATDGVSHVYSAFPAVTTGPQSDILVARSGDGGRTFSAPIRVGSTVAGARINLLPELSAFSDGHVYLVYMSDNPGVGREIRFNRSTDYGATWQPSDTVLATLATHGSGYFENYDWPGTQLAALFDGTVYVVWSDSANVFLTRSTNFGVSFAAADVDQDSRGFNRDPRICTSNSTLVLTWLSPNTTVTAQSIWGVASPDKGMTWGATKQLRSDPVAGGVDLHALACDGNGHAVDVWSDGRSGPLALYSARYGGANFAAEAVVAAPAGVNAQLPDVTYVGPSQAVVVYGDQLAAAYASRSTDDGATFSSFQKLDDAAPDPAAPSYLERVAADGAGNVWAVWLDGSAGQLSIAARRSADSGATYGPVYRLDRKTPQGGFDNTSFFPPYGSPAAVLPGALIASWVGQRESSTYDAVVNAYDVNDFDRDGAASVTDCNDLDPDVKSPPSEVSAVGATKITGATRIAWASQDAVSGAGTRYDVVTGLLSALRSSGTYAAATCLANNVADTPYDDTRAAPASGDGFYYLVRAANNCATASYGSSGEVPDSRDALDTSGPCP